VAYPRGIFSPSYHLDIASEKRSDVEGGGERFRSLRRGMRSGVKWQTDSKASCLKISRVAGQQMKLGCGEGTL
jgi:hypothetical protein